MGMYLSVMRFDCTATSKVFHLGKSTACMPLWNRVVIGIYLICKTYYEGWWHYDKVVLYFIEPGDAILLFLHLALSHSSSWSMRDTELVLWYLLKVNCAPSAFWLTSQYVKRSDPVTWPISFFGREIRTWEHLNDQTVRCCCQCLFDLCVCYGNRQGICLIGGHGRPSLVNFRHHGHGFTFTWHHMLLLTSGGFPQYERFWWNWNTSRWMMGVLRHSIDEQCLDQLSWFVTN